MLTGNVISMRSDAPFAPFATFAGLVAGRVFPVGAGWTAGFSALAGARVLGRRNRVLRRRCRLRRGRVLRGTACFTGAFAAGLGERRASCLWAAAEAAGLCTAFCTLAVLAFSGAASGAARFTAFLAAGFAAVLTAGRAAGALRAGAFLACLRTVLLKMGASGKGGGK